MVDGNRTNINKLGQIILVRDVVSMPRDDVERRVFLFADEKLASQLVHDFPRRLFNLVLGCWVQEVAGIGQTVCSQGAELGELELCAPDFWLVLEISVLCSHII